MKRKINQMLVLIATLAIFLTMVLITVVFYDLFRKQVMGDLHAYAVMLEQGLEIESIHEIADELSEEELRITVVNKTGIVEFDSEADSAVMENHSQRPEIIEAMETGVGRAVRNSETLSKNTFYYAIRLDDGSVLRVAKDAGSIFSIFAKAVPSLVLVVGVLVIICLMVAHFLTKKLIQPIELLAENLDEYNAQNDYEELTPFISMIQTQHQDIIKNARIREEFTANVSHELKTPLTSISGYAELIETGMASEKDVVRFAQGIHKSSNRLLSLINDIIRLSELDGTEQEIVMEQVNLYELAVTCVEMLTLNAEKHDVEISMEGTPCFVKGNKQMLEELLYNLCDNAIRYNNPQGKVSVETVPKEHGALLIVKDTGIGISKEHQERIFERFYRVDKSRSKLTGGTGLGLAIVKHIIARHDAGLELESEIGKGTTVRVDFS